MNKIIAVNSESKENSWRVVTRWLWMQLMTPYAGVRDFYRIRDIDPSEDTAFPSSREKSRKLIAFGRVPIVGGVRMFLTRSGSHTKRR